MHAFTGLTITAVWRNGESHCWSTLCWGDNLVQKSFFLFMLTVVYIKSLEWRNQIKCINTKVSVRQNQVLFFKDVRYQEFQLSDHLQWFLCWNMHAFHRNSKVIQGNRNYTTFILLCTVWGLCSPDCSSLVFCDINSVKKKLFSPTDFVNMNSWQLSILISSHNMDLLVECTLFTVARITWNT